MELFDDEVVIVVVMRYDVVIGVVNCIPVVSVVAVVVLVAFIKKNNNYNI
jgi:hypothetical protein